MIDEAAMKRTLQAYLAAFNRGDLDAIVAFFAEDATIEDPVGTAPKVGKAQITQFYRASMAGGAKLELAAPVRGSHGASAAMAFDVHLALPPGQGRGVIRVIDVMDFDREGKISSMRAFWGRDDMQLQPA